MLEGAVLRQLLNSVMTREHLQLVPSAGSLLSACRHQDMAYWPPFTSDTATATCWLAVSEATEENGCMRFVAGSHREAELRPHAPGASTQSVIGYSSTHRLFPPDADMPRQPAGRHDMPEALDPPKLARQLPGSTALSYGAASSAKDQEQGACALCGMSRERPLMGVPGVQ